MPSRDTAAPQWRGGRGDEKVTFKPTGMPSSAPQREVWRWRCHRVRRPALSSSLPSSPPPSRLRGRLPPAHGAVFSLRLSPKEEASPCGDPPALVLAKSPVLAPRSDRPPLPSPAFPTRGLPASACDTRARTSPGPARVTSFLQASGKSCLYSDFVFSSTSPSVP